VTFSIFTCFLHIQPAVFQAPDKAVILSEALRRPVANRGLYSAESKDPGAAYLTHAVRAFSTTEAPTWRAQVRTAGRILFSGFRGRKAPNGMGKISILGVLRLRATSAVSRDKSVRRSAQDDGFVGMSTKNILNKLALMGLRPGLSSAVLKGSGAPISLQLLFCVNFSSAMAKKPAAGTRTRGYRLPDCWKIAETAKLQGNLTDERFPVMGADQRAEEPVARFQPE